MDQVTREQKKYSFKYISDSCVLYKTRYLGDYHLIDLLITKSNGTMAITLRHANPANLAFTGCYGWCPRGYGCSRGDPQRCRRR